MEEIIIPALNIKLSSVVRRKAADTIQRHLQRYDLADLNYRLPSNKVSILDYVLEDYATVQGKEDKLLYISILLQHLCEMLEEIGNSPNKSNSREDKDSVVSIEDLQYDLHAEINNLGFKIDDNQFTSKEVIDLNSKVNEILSKLDELKGGHEVLFERIEELKDDFTDIQTTIPLGKKTTVQRLSGVIVPYIGQKGADEVYNIISPIIKAAIKQHLPTLIG